MKPKKVFLIGAGPGDAELLTVKALKIIQQADVILFDNLVSTEIRNLFPAGCKKIFVGKRKNNHSMTQQELNQLMIKLYRKGNLVCRVKGGDPFIFGRGSEEMLTLKKAQVPVEVIPGITAASGCSSYAGFPLTHRGLSQGCTFITAHAENNLNIDWKALAELKHTLVFYMGLTQIETIATKLVENGLNRETSCAVVEKGTTRQQRVIVSQLSQLSNKALQHHFQSPSLIIIGKVTQLRQQLAWFESETQECDQLLTA